MMSHLESSFRGMMNQIDYDYEDLGRKKKKKDLENKDNIGKA